MIKIRKPELSDLPAIQKILANWTEAEEVQKYTDRIANEINGSTEFNMQFWALEDNDHVIGVGGTSIPVPKLQPFFTTSKSVELKILYLDPNSRGKGAGKELLSFIEKEAIKRGFTEMLLRSAEKYKDTAYGFYEKMGYDPVGKVEGGDKTKKMQVFRKLLKL